VGGADILTMSSYEYGDGDWPRKGEVGMADVLFDQLWPLTPLMTDGELI